ncbi:MAG: hypothetical protein GF353_08765 [Candidatus Lokiarchaeota archaeon]|nr:hypothetical protein [Candidatus Lokiarchaeota archaeon]
MAKVRKQFKLDEEITIERIPEKHCMMCLNQMYTEQKLCNTCRHLPLYIGDWNFKSVNALGIYHKYKQKGYSIPINVLSELILLLKFRKGKKFRTFAGSLIAKGLFKIFEEKRDIYNDVSHVVISPKFKSNEENQVEYILNPFIEILNQNGYDIENLSKRVKRLEDVGRNKEKGFEERFNDINGVHEVRIDDLGHADIIILDDIFTTGSTSWDIARALKERNAGNIHVLVAGRHWLFDEWPINTLYSNGDFSFDYLINYFSRTDYNRDRKKISKVIIIKLDVQENYIYALIKGSRGNYELDVDLDNNILSHSCPDFKNDKKRNKKFCKHISKAFLNIRKGNEKFSSSVLNSIYRELDIWQFDMK